MDNLEVVKAISEAAINTMKDKKILASFVVSVALYNLNSVSDTDAGTLFEAKNIMKRKAGKKYNSDFIILDGTRGIRFKKYDTFEECIDDWLLTFKSASIKEIWELDTILATIQVKEYSKVNLQPFIDAYLLDDMDKRILGELYPSNQSIIEVPVTSAVDTYRELSNYKEKVEPKTAMITKVPVKVPKEKKPIQLVKGEKIAVRCVNMFKNPTDSIASRSFTGNIWLYNGNELNGRYAVVTNKEYLTKSRDYIDGYIKKSDIV